MGDRYRGARHAQSPKPGIRETARGIAITVEGPPGVFRTVRAEFMPGPRMLALSMQLHGGGPPQTIWLNARHRDVLADTMDCMRLTEELTRK